MEDEAFYDFMLDDLERLERVHHHREFVPETQESDKAVVGEHPHSPVISGIVSAVTGAVKTTVDAVAAKIHDVTERRKSVVSGSSGH